MEKPCGYSHSQKHAAATSSPPSLRSRSGSSTPSAISLPEVHTFALNSSIPVLNRSKLTTKSKTRNVEEKLLPNIHLSTFSSNTRKNLPKEKRDYSANQSPRRSQSKIEVPRRSSSANTSPSAWALSPGRSPYLMPKPPMITTSKKEKLCGSKGSGGGVSGALMKYFRQKKVSHLKEEEYHQFRIMHNRLLQWRFANARSEASMTAAKRVAQKKLFNAWVRISIIRKLLVGKKIQMQKWNLEIKLYSVVSCGQVNLLKEWKRMETKNCEAVGRLARKLSAISDCLPLVEGAKADAIAFADAMSMATRVMESIEATIADFQSQVEKICYLMTELSVVLKEQNECESKLQQRLCLVNLLKEEEKCLRVQNIQLVKAWRRGED